MCGLAGIYHYGEPDRRVDEALLLRMTRALAHRGPDDEALWIDGPVGFGHRRLAIVDLSPTGRQPMLTPDRAACLAYNGEFYDHARHRPELAARGVSFRGSSDTETLLHLMRLRGPDALAHISGIFAFAYWDAAQRELTLARDPLGVKQLYFHDDGRRILFASEIKALLECAEVARAIDPAALNEYLHFHTPLFERTFFRDIQQVRAGECVRVGRRGISRRTYWSLSDFTPARERPRERIDALRALLGEVVSDQLLADVPVAAFFSGGIDSSAVTAFARRAGSTPRAFGVHFTDQDVVDERPFQEAAARALGVKLDLITVDGGNFPSDLLRLMYFQDQPVIGAAMIPMYHVSRLAACHVKVCLGGQAADEIFGGYARYALAQPWQVARSWLGRRFSRPPGGLQPAASGGVGGNLWKQLADPATLRRLARSALHLTDWRTRYFENFAKVPERTWRGVLADPALVSRARCRATFDEVIERSPATSPADKVMHWDLQTYLTGLFQQDDRMSMANSLESRVPLADPRVVRFAFQCGPDLKFRAGASKWILRQAVADVIPAEVLNRRKVGFDTPAASWMKRRHRDFVHDLLLSTRSRTRGLVNPGAVERLLARPDLPHWFDVVWKLVCIEAWASIFLDRNVPVGVTLPTHATGPVARVDGPLASPAK